MDGRADGWLEGLADTEGGLLGCKLGTPVAVGLMLGCEDGPAEIDGC